MEAAAEVARALAESAQRLAEKDEELAQALQSAERAQALAAENAALQQARPRHKLYRLWGLLPARVCLLERRLKSRCVAPLPLCSAWPRPWPARRGWWIRRLHRRRPTQRARQRCSSVTHLPPLCACSRSQPALARPHVSLLNPATTTPQKRDVNAAKAQAAQALAAQEQAFLNVRPALTARAPPPLTSHSALGCVCVCACV